MGASERDTNSDVAATRALAHVAGFEPRQRHTPGEPQSRVEIELKSDSKSCRNRVSNPTV